MVASCSLTAMTPVKEGICRRSSDSSAWTVEWRVVNDTIGPATQNAVCRSGLRSLSAAECYILSRPF